MAEKNHSPKLSSGYNWEQIVMNMWHAAEESSKYQDECAFNVHFMEHHLSL